jgi:hypothetical protein
MDWPAALLPPPKLQVCTSSAALADSSKGISATSLGLSGASTPW